MSYHIHILSYAKKHKNIFIASSYTNKQESSPTLWYSFFVSAHKLSLMSVLVFKPCICRAPNATKFQLDNGSVSRHFRNMHRAPKTTPSPHLAGHKQSPNLNWKWQWWNLYNPIYAQYQKAFSTRKRWGLGTTGCSSLMTQTFWLSLNYCSFWITSGWIWWKNWYVRI